MIIYTAPFILAAAAANQPLYRARIGYQTYTQNAVPADVVASSDSVSFPRDAMLRPDTYEFWTPTALPATWQLEFNATRSFDYVGIAAHNLFTCGCQVKVEYQLGAGAWTTFVTDTAPGDNSPMMFLGSAVSASRVRLTITGGSLMPSIAVFYVGIALAMEKGVSGGYKPINMSRDTVLQNSLSRGGQFLGQDYRRNGVSGSASFKKLTAAWVRANFDAFSKAARKYPYFFAWNPEQFPLEVGYVWTEDDIVPEYEGLIDLMDVTWKMKGVGTP